MTFSRDSMFWSSSNLLSPDSSLITASCASCWANCPIWSRTSPRTFAWQSTDFVYLIVWSLICFSTSRTGTRCFWKQQIVSRLRSPRTITSSWWKLVPSSAHLFGYWSFGFLFAADFWNSRETNTRAGPAASTDCFELWIGHFLTSSFWFSWQD